jgi:hypothetical protein
MCVTWGKGSINCWKEKPSVPARKNIMMQASTIMPTISSIYGLTHPSGSAVMEIFSVMEENGKIKQENVKWFKDAKREDLEDALFGQKM